MWPRGIKHDPEHGKSKQRIDEVGLLKKECERTRKALPDFLRGHVFRITRYRINRHLKRCAVCRSELDALRHVEETNLLLKDVDLPGGIGHFVKECVLSLAKLKILLYRPLWLAGIGLVIAGIYYYAIQPRQFDIELENIVGTASVRTAPTPSLALKTKTNVVKKAKRKAKTKSKKKAKTKAKTKAKVKSKAKDVQKRAPQPVSAPAVKPLAVSITPNNEISAIRRINRVMGEHARLRNMKFSDTNRTFSGKLTSPELLTFFDRIREVSKVRYSRKRFKSFPVAQQIPFVLTLKAAPKTVEQREPETIEQSVPIQTPLQSAETHTPAATETPSPPATAPSPAGPDGGTPEVPRT
jgi:hypothetical protein